MTGIDKATLDVRPRYSYDPGSPFLTAYWGAWWRIKGLPLKDHPIGTAIAMVPLGWPDQLHLGWVVGAHSGDVLVEVEAVHCPGCQCSPHQHDDDDDGPDGQTSGTE